MALLEVNGIGKSFGATAVLRDISTRADACAKARESVEDTLDAIVVEAYESVARTPDLLPVLKENGVVLVLADNVTITGDADATVVVAGEGSQVSMKGYTGDATVSVVADDVALTNVPAGVAVLAVEGTDGVTVNGKTYYDMSNGENRVSTLHKVSVPMSELDNAKSYTLSSTPVYSEAAYLSVSGKERQKTYSFRPADSSDGLQIYNISDNHEVLSGAANAGRYFGYDLDILILNGDNINDVSSLWQISLIYKLASRITGGERPVIYVRGNHECNGRYAADLPDYLPGKDGNLYYTTTLGGAFFMVLDTNCDMSDENLLITPAANFEELRREQTEWLNAQTYFGGDCDYSILLAHMAFPLSDYERFPEWTEELTAATDGRFDVCISGHSHVLDYAEAGTETRTSYPVIRGSIRSNRRTSGEGVNPFEFTGTAIECTGGNMNVKFTISNREVLQEFSIDLR